MRPAVFHSAPSIHLQIPSDVRRMSSGSPFPPSSPMNGSSPGLMTPTDEYAFSPASVANQTPIQDYDLTSMFLTYPGIMGVNEGTFPPLQEYRCHKQAGHCGCVLDPTNYSNMLELSLRLRKASDVLSRSPTHQMGSFCPLNQRISELDSFTTSVDPSKVTDMLGINPYFHRNLLSDIATNPSDRVQSQSMQTYQSSQLFSQRMAPVQRDPIPNRPWDIMSSSSNSPTALDDSFMTWEPPRRS